MQTRQRQPQRRQKQRQRQLPRLRTEPEQQAAHNVDNRLVALSGIQQAQNLILPYLSAPSHPYPSYRGRYLTYTGRSDHHINKNELGSDSFVPQLGMPYPVGYQQESMSRRPFEAVFMPQYSGSRTISPWERSYTAYYNPFLEPGFEYPSTLPRFPNPGNNRGYFESHAVEHSNNILPCNSNDVPRVTESLPQPDMNDPPFCLTCHAKLVNGPLSHPLTFEQWHSPEACVEQRSLNEKYAAKIREQKKTQTDALAREANTQAVELAAELPTATEQPQMKENDCKAETVGESNGAISSVVEMQASTPSFSSGLTEEAKMSGGNNSSIPLADLHEQSSASHPPKHDKKVHSSTATSSGSGFMKSNREAGEEIKGVPLALSLIQEGEDTSEGKDEPDVLVKNGEYDFCD